MKERRAIGRICICLDDNGKMPSHNLQELMRKDEKAAVGSYKAGEQMLDNISIIYCPYHDVQTKYQCFLNDKAKFLVKILKLKNNGKKLLTSKMLDAWVKSNMHWLYYDDKLRDIFMKQSSNSKDIDNLLALKCEHRRKE